MKPTVIPVQRNIIEPYIDFQFKIDYVSGPQQNVNVAHCRLSLDEAKQMISDLEQAIKDAQR